MKPKKVEDCFEITNINLDTLEKINLGLDLLKKGLNEIFIKEENGSSEIIVNSDGTITLKAPKINLYETQYAVKSEIKKN